MAAVLSHFSPRAFGKYRLLRQIGRGGMADVYEAELPVARGVSKRLALKLLLPGLKHKAQVIRSFVDEATIAARLVHRNIVQTFDFGEIEGVLFIAMEYVDGWDLRALSAHLDHQHRRMPIEAAVYIVHELAVALDYIHTRDEPVVHRDVTPHNLFVTRDGHVKLGDFGIAKWATREGYTESGQIKGKLAYLAPEQVTGDPVTPRTDIYAAGLILFELATGQRLLSGRNEVELIQNASAPQVVPPSTLNPAAAVLDDLVLRALRPHPTLRLPTAALLSERLRALLQQQPCDSRAISDLVLTLAEQDAPGTRDLVGREASPPHSPASGSTEPTVTRPLPPAPRRATAAESRPRGPRRVIALAAMGLVITALAAVMWHLGTTVSETGRRQLVVHHARPDARDAAAPGGPRLEIPPASGRQDASRDDLLAVLPVAPAIAADSAVGAARPSVRRRRPRLRRPPIPQLTPPPLATPPPKPPVDGPKMDDPRPALRRLLDQARGKGLFAGDDSEFDQRLAAVRQAVKLEGVAETRRRLEQLRGYVEGFRVDRHFANKKLARLERAIERAELSDHQRQELTVSAQRILRLILNNQLEQASRLISAQLQTLARGATRP